MSSVLHIRLVAPAMILLLGGFATPGSAQSRYILEGLGSGKQAADVFTRLAPSEKRFVGCLYSADDPLADCRLVDPSGVPDGFPRDTVRMLVDRATGIATSLEFRGYLRLRAVDSTYTALADVLRASWGKPGLGYELPNCTEWGSTERGARLCRYSDRGLLQLFMFDALLADSAKAAAHRDPRTSRARLDYLTWWPVWEPFLLRDARAGQRLEAILSEMGVERRSSPFCDRRAETSDLDSGDQKCTWPGVEFSVAGRRPRALAASMNRSTRRVLLWRLEFDLMSKEQAEAVADSIGAELAQTWGPPSSKTDHSTKWRRLPFESSVGVLCEDMCEPGERWQVWLMMNAYPAAEERDQADVTRF